MNIDIKVDVNGHVCPIPAAETRKALKKAISGQIIEIKGDFEHAVGNIIKMVKKNNGLVIEKEVKPEYFKVIIEKL